eukprot:7961503-Lingulodinium_polyedra.AAC.1
MGHRDWATERDFPLSVPPGKKARILATKDGAQGQGGVPSMGAENSLGMDIEDNLGAENYLAAGIEDNLGAENYLAVGIEDNLGAENNLGMESGDLAQGRPEGLAGPAAPGPAVLLGH